MAGDPYGDRALVALYDGDNPAGADHAFYRALAESVDARAVVDLGCGTGLLTRTLAHEGRRVVGIDPSETMLDWARQQPGASAVTWVLGDAREIRPSADLDLVICTGNALMHVPDHDLVPVLQRVRAGLRPGGVLAFETRDPAAAEWRSWTPGATRSERDSPIGRLREWLEVTRTELDGDGQGLVAFDAHNVLADGTDRVATSELWFRGAETITTALLSAGFEEPQIDGGWAGELVGPGSRLLVVRAVRRG